MFLAELQEQHRERGRHQKQGSEEFYRCFSDIIVLICKNWHKGSQCCPFHFSQVAQKARLSTFFSFFFGPISLFWSIENTFLHYVKKRFMVYTLWHFFLLFTCDNDNIYFFENKQLCLVLHFAVIAFCWQFVKPHIFWEQYLHNLSFIKKQLCEMQ